MIFINKGDMPLTKAQAETRGLRIFNSQMASWKREAAVLLESAEYRAWATQWVANNEINSANNSFNLQLSDYRAAVARLARYRLADGRAEVIEQREIGLMDDLGEPVLEDFIAQPFIAPLEPQVEQAAYNDEGEATESVMVDNPIIIQDDAERTEAQSVVDDTPQEVIDWIGAGQ